MRKYVIKYNSRNCIEISKPINTTLIYKIPYINLKNKTHNIDIQNRFVVYILFGKNENGKDFVYVGKSKNGIDYRPTAHENKNVNWDICYVLTDIKERTILNDGTTQYIEDKICNRINQIDRYTNTTKQTTSGTANTSDMEDCDEFLKETYKMLFVLGLNLFENDDEEDSITKTTKPYEVKSGVKPLYEKVEKLIKNEFPNVVIEHMACYIKFSVNGKIITTICTTNTVIKMNFNIKVGQMNDPNNLLIDMTGLGNHGVGNYRLLFSNDNCFDDIRDFLQQTYEFQITQS